MWHQIFQPLSGHTLQSLFSHCWHFHSPPCSLSIRDGSLFELAPQLLQDLISFWAEYRILLFMTSISPLKSTDDTSVSPLTSMGNNIHDFNIFFQFDVSVDNFDFSDVYVPVLNLSFIQIDDIHLYGSNFSCKEHWWCLSFLHFSALMMFMALILADDAVITPLSTLIFMFKASICHFNRNDVAPISQHWCFCSSLRL